MKIEYRIEKNRIRGLKLIPETFDESQKIFAVFRDQDRAGFYLGELPIELISKGLGPVPYLYINADQQGDEPAKEPQEFDALIVVNDREEMDDALSKTPGPLMVSVPIGNVHQAAAQAHRRGRSVETVTLSVPPCPGPIGKVGPGPEATDIPPPFPEPQREQMTRFAIYGRYAVYSPYDSHDGVTYWTVQRVDPSADPDDGGEQIGEFGNQTDAVTFAAALEGFETGEG